MINDKDGTNAVVENIDTLKTSVNNNVSREQIAAYLEMMQKKHNSQCRKKGFKDHFHQPSGTSLGRHLAKRGSVYGRLSTVDQAFREIRLQKAQLKSV